MQLLPFVIILAILEYNLKNWKHQVVFLNAFSGEIRIQSKELKDIWQPNEAESPHLLWIQSKELKERIRDNSIYQSSQKEYNLKNWKTLFLHQALSRIQWIQSKELKGYRSWYRSSQTWSWIQSKELKGTEVSLCYAVSI